MYQMQNYATATECDEESLPWRWLRHRGGGNESSSARGGSLSASSGGYAHPESKGAHKTHTRMGGDGKSRSAREATPDRIYGIGSSGKTLPRGPSQPVSPQPSLPAAPGAKETTVGNLSIASSSRFAASEEPGSPTLAARPTLTLYMECHDDDAPPLQHASLPASIPTTPYLAALLTPDGGGGSSFPGGRRISATPVVPVQPHTEAEDRHNLAQRMARHFGPDGDITREEKAKFAAKLETDNATRAEEKKKVDEKAAKSDDKKKAAKDKKPMPAPPKAALTKEQIIRIGAQRLYKRLGQVNLCVHRVRNDGNCQFRAIAQQLLGSEHYHDVIRHHVISYMKRVRAEKFDFYFGSKTQADRYFDHLSKPGSWGDELTLRGASDSLFIRIHVLSSEERNFYITYEPSEDAPPPPTFLIDVEKYKEMKRRRGQSMQSGAFGSQGSLFSLSPTYTGSAGRHVDPQGSRLLQPTAPGSGYPSESLGHSVTKAALETEDYHDEHVDASALQMAVQEKLMHSFIHTIDLADVEGLDGGGAGGPAMVPSESEVQSSVMGKFTKAGGTAHYKDEQLPLQLLQPQVAPTLTPVRTQTPTQAPASSGRLPVSSMSRAPVHVAGSPLAPPSFTPHGHEEVALLVSNSRSIPYPGGYSLPSSFDPHGFRGGGSASSYNHNQDASWIQSATASMVDYTGGGGGSMTPSHSFTTTSMMDGHSTGGGGGKLCFVFENRTEPVDVFLSYLYPVHFNAVGVVDANNKGNDAVMPATPCSPMAASLRSVGGRDSAFNIPGTPGPVSPGRTGSVTASFLRLTPMEEPVATLGPVLGYDGTDNDSSRTPGESRGETSLFGQLPTVLDT